MKDYYSTLGVSRDATEGDMKKAFRKKAMDYHPDRNKENPKAEEKFKEVNEEYAFALTHLHQREPKNDDLLDLYLNQSIAIEN